MNSKEKTLEEQLADAEARCDELADEVSDAEDALREARSALEDAEEERDAIEEKIKGPVRAALAALLADRAGPMRPIGDRVVRQSCALSEIPAWFGEMRKEFGVKGVMCSGRMFAGNPFAMISVECVDGLVMMPDGIEKTLGPAGSPLNRDDLPILEDSNAVRTFGHIAANLRLTSLVEDLFPRCAWHSPGGELDPLSALVDGVLVAVVMPIRRLRAAA